MHLAQLFDNIDWSPAVGDPTVMGWVIVVCYGVAEWLCVTNYRRRKTLIDHPRQRRLGIYWFALSLGMLFMGFNKQLDLQVLLHEIGRELAHEHGLFGGSRGVKMAFLAGLMLVALIGLAWFITLMKSLADRVLISAAGVCVLIAFVLYRAVAIYIEHLPLGGVVVPGFAGVGSAVFALGALLALIGGVGFYRLKRSMQVRAA